MNFNSLTKQLKQLKDHPIPKTGNYMLKKGQVVANKTQQAMLQRAKTAKQREKIIKELQRKKPRRMKTTRFVRA